MSPKPKPSLSEWISLVAVCVAALALIISAWQAFMVRRHNELSVRPLLDIEITEEVASDHHDVVWLILRNDGLGPAIIEAHGFEHDSTLLSQDQLVELMSSLLAPRHVIEVDLLRTGAIVKPGESHRFMRFHRDVLLSLTDQQLELADVYRRFFSLDITVRYRDLYDRKHSFGRRVNTLFPRSAERYEPGIAENN